MKMVLVEWIDAVSYDAWDSLSCDLGPRKVLSVGFVVKENDEGLVLCLNWDSAEKDGSCFMAIPKGMINRVFELGDRYAKELVAKNYRDN